jgi:hypothetical protein
VTLDLRYLSIQYGLEAPQDHLPIRVLVVLYGARRRLREARMILGQASSRLHSPIGGFLRPMALDAPEAADAAEAIKEAAEDERELAHVKEREAERTRAEHFRRRAAIVIGVLAMLLAISGLGGGNATKEMLNANIQASDTYAFYQAKNIRQTSNQLAADALETELAAHSDLPADVQASIRDRIGRYNATVARYESEPSTGEGKVELLAKAQAFEQRRDRAARQDPNFDFAQALFQIAIVLGSVSIVAASRWLLVLGSGLGVAATLLMINGFLLLVELPIG